MADANQTSGSAKADGDEIEVKCPSPLLGNFEKARMVRPAVGRPKLVAGRKVAKISMFFRFDDCRGIVLATGENTVVLDAPVSAYQGFDDQRLRTSSFHRQLKRRGLQLRRRVERGGNVIGFRRQGSA